ncbi:MAG: AMP-binding protein [Rhodocyclaceae bacterium]|nr:AMP-binding protein [Rhodocyclaceae bacterium]MCA3034033.1 AMP-binding protein [Rhodocyclaceae bacterium]MCA3082966.1 AMP-binding protein [Rhodocyclaceae bacterium]
MRFFRADELDSAALYLENGRCINYAELSQEVDAFSRAFGESGIVFCLCNNDFPSLRCYLTTLQGVATALLLPGSIQKPQLDTLLAAYAPRYLFHNRPDLLNYGATIWNADGYSLVKCRGSHPYEIHPDLALLLATSGSAGFPKLVRLSRRNLEANADAIVKYLSIDAGERAISSLPIHYSYGLSVINSHLRAGASVVLTNRSIMDPEFWRLVRRHKVTSFSGVPYTYEMLLKLRIERLDMPTIKTMTQAGGRLAADKTKLVAEACSKKHIRFFSMYGQTEATARMSYLPPERAFDKAGSIGLPIPGGSLWLEDEHGNTIAQQDVVGELCFRGPNVSLGYATSYTDLSVGDVNLGVLKTGDLASFDADGYFQVVGRLSRFLKVFGVRVSLDAVESLLANQGFHAAAFGNDDSLNVCLYGPNAGDPKSIRTQLSANLMINESAISVFRVAELPRLSNGKVDYQTLSKELIR